MSTERPEPQRTPVTGNPEIDEVLAGVELGPDVHTHPKLLADALEAISGTLNDAQQPPS